MKIYLAGKVTKNGWRTRLVPGAELDGCRYPHEDEWPILECAIFGEHDFVGPFLYGCDHGCGHGEGLHGIGAGSTICLGGDDSISKAEVVRRCLDAVRRADMVFCWLDAPEDYGSMVEVGFALALGKAVVVAGVERFADLTPDFDFDGPAPAGNPLLESHWFASAASVLVTGEKPEEALRYAIAGARSRAPAAAPAPAQYSLPVEAWKKCGSPIEKALLTGLVTAASRVAVHLVLKLDGRDIKLTDAAGPRLTVYPQHKVCDHRADFVVEYGSVKAVVECDGHDFHERTKKQVQHDRELDRAFQREGFRVFRFTGSEIWQSPEDCAASLIRDLQGAEVRA